MKGAATITLIAAALLPLGWHAYAAATDATLISFRTGSMAPTMPQGSIAISHPVTADEIEVGDVVTVRRDDARLPVTHRVVDVLPVADDTTARDLVLRGDDNEHNDPYPYTVTEARRVDWAMPGVGNAIMLLQSPFGMGLLVLVAGAFTVWAFWPAPKPRYRRGTTPATEQPAPTPTSDPAQLLRRDLRASRRATPRTPHTV